ncbi:hypothetical protein BH09ACT2_BH09ACT2_11020 [soil metagenome]
MAGGPAAGWYPDPAGSAALRWWSGASWTEHFAPVPEQPAPIGDAASTPERVGGLFDPIAPQVLGAAPLAQTVQPTKASAHTWGVWLIASVAAVAVGVRTVSASLLPMSPVVAIVTFFALLALVASLAIWDRRVLRARGLRAASAWWILLLPPLAYFVARRVALKKQGIRANAPGNVYVLTIFAAAALTSVALAPMALARMDAASLRLLEQQASAELQRQTAVSWTVSCPDGAPVTIVGSSFDCAAIDATGRAVRFTAHVLHPREFSVDPAVLQ